MPTIYNSPSTQEHNIGALPGYIEETVMNRLCDRIEKLQDYNGIRHYRNKPTMTLGQAINDSNAKYKAGKFNSKNYIHCAYHTNADGGQGTARGGVSLYYPNSQEGKRYATIMMKYLSPVTPSADRGIASRPDLGELRSTAAVSNITEFIFHTNKADAADMINNMDKYAEAAVKAQCEYFGIPFKSPQSNPELKVLYWVYVNDVQIGPYEKKEYAFNKANGYKKGHIVIKSSTGETLLDEDRTDTEPSVLYWVYVNDEPVGPYEKKEYAFNKASEYKTGHVVIKVYTVETLLDENRTK